MAVKKSSLREKMARQKREKYIHNANVELLMGMDALLVGLKEGWHKGLKDLPFEIFPYFKNNKVDKLFFLPFFERTESFPVVIAYRPQEDDLVAVVMKHKIPKEMLTPDVEDMQIVSMEKFLADGRKGYHKLVKNLEETISDTLKAAYKKCTESLL